MRAALIAVAAALVLAAPAKASIVFERGNNATSIYIANDDGTGARRLAPGRQPLISPDGQTVIYTGDSDTDPDGAALREIPAAGGASKALLDGVVFGVLEWSPDGRYVAALTGPFEENDLVLIDRATGTHRRIATGDFFGASFSPASDKLLYGLTRNARTNAPTDLYVVATAAGGPARFTHDGRSAFPVWGPQKIAYTHWQKPPRKQDAPKYNIWLVNPDGSGVKHLTHDRAPFLLEGLIPIDWSADGTRLLADFGFQDTSYIVTVDPATGAEHVVGPKTKGYYPARLSADGSTILGQTGGSVFGQPQKIFTIPYAGGKATMLASGELPDWTR